MDETQGPEQGGSQPSETAPGMYPAVYEKPGVEFPPEIEDDFPAVYEPAPNASYAAAIDPAMLPATYEPAPEPGAAPHSTPQAATQQAAVAQFAPEAGPAPAHRCPWCSVVAPPGATHCTNCHASLAERESLGDILVPGVTGIDPTLLHRNDVINKVMAVPGAKLGTLGIGLSIAATIAQEMDRRSETKAPSLGIGVPPTDALELARRLDVAGETAGMGAALTEPTPPSLAASIPAPTPAPTPSPQVSPWADTPWASEIPVALEHPEGETAQIIETVPDEADD